MCSVTGLMLLCKIVKENECMHELNIISNQELAIYIAICIITILHIFYYEVFRMLYATSLHLYKFLSSVELY